MSILNNQKTDLSISNLIVNKGSLKYFAIDSTNFTIINNKTDSSATNYETDCTSMDAKSFSTFMNHGPFSSSSQTNPITNSRYENSISVSHDNSYFESNKCFKSNNYSENTYGTQVSQFTQNPYFVKNDEKFCSNNYSQDFFNPYISQSEKRILDKENFVSKNEAFNDLDLNTDTEFDQLDLTLISNQIFDFSSENSNLTNFESDFRFEKDFF